MWVTSGVSIRRGRGELDALADVQPERGAEQPHAVAEQYRDDVQLELIQQPARQDLAQRCPLPQPRRTGGAGPEDGVLPAQWAGSRLKTWDAVLLCCTRAQDQGTVPRGTTQATGWLVTCAMSS